MNEQYTPKNQGLAKEFEALRQSPSEAEDKRAMEMMSDKEKMLSKKRFEEHIKEMKNTAIMCHNMWQFAKADLSPDIRPAGVTDNITEDDINEMKQCVRMVMKEIEKLEEIYKKDFKK